MSIKSTLRITGLAATLCGTYIFLAACGSADSNANLANTVGTGVVNTNGIPPGFSTSPVAINGPIPGIPDPANANQPIKPGLTPTPGIPDPKNANRKPRPGATPTPGIPSPEEIRRQMQRQNPAAVNSPSMMRSNSAPSMMRSTNANGPRTSRKP